MSQISDLKKAIDAKKSKTECDRICGGCPAYPLCAKPDKQLSIAFAACTSFFVEFSGPVRNPARHLEALGEARDLLRIKLETGIRKQCYLSGHLIGDIPLEWLQSISRLWPTIEISSWWQCESRDIHCMLRHRGGLLISELADRKSWEKYHE